LFFAHDTIAYLTITSENDTLALQTDLNKLGIWEKKRKMEFHPGKCNVLRDGPFNLRGIKILKGQ
jgi:hypothetical protein